MRLGSGAPVLVAAALLAGCGLGPQTGVNVAPGIGTAAAVPERSWMAPGTTAEDLLYAAAYGSGKVYVFSYPDGKLVGTLTGLDGPWGVCASKTNDVWITNFVSRNIVEYERGGTQPIKTLTDSSGYPVACSVDPSTGNLAVANVYAPHNGRGGILIFDNASGTPKAYTAANLYYYYSVGYDSGGALFADGTAVHGSFGLVLLPKDATAFETIATKQKIHYPVGVQWLGSYLAVGDTTNSGPGESGVVHVKISNGSGKELYDTKVTGDVQAFEVAGSFVVASEGDGVLLFDYPDGGSPKKKIQADGMQEALGVAISVAKTGSR
jgi:hypothetical protein